MCGIFGRVGRERSDSENNSFLDYGLHQIRHRGPDGQGTWVSSQGDCALGHVRLAVIDIVNGQQPFCDEGRRFHVTFNGEIYNFKELRSQLSDMEFKTNSDTEVLLKAYMRWGEQCLEKLSGMFAFAIWDDKEKTLFCARDRFGIKPFYWTQNSSEFLFGSEIKALVPFLGVVNIDENALSEYFSFQFSLGKKCLIENIYVLPPAHSMVVKIGQCPKIRKYWEVNYDISEGIDEGWVGEKLEDLLQQSMRLHLTSDVPIAAYVSGGVDSSMLAAIANQMLPYKIIGYNGRFKGDAYDESTHASKVADENNFDLRKFTFSEEDFVNNIDDVFWALDLPVAGPGVFPQYMVSKRVAEHFKVVIGGQGGDEIFGGYVRYLIGYFQQCIKAGVEGSSENGNFVVSYKSILPNLVTLKNYTPLINSAWQGNIFADLDDGYWGLINRGNNYAGLVADDLLDPQKSKDNFKTVFWGKNVRKEAYFDLMTHFDFKTLLPSLLHVEDRVSMAHGLEARVPFLDTELVEFAATLPADLKFKNGELKRLLKHQARKFLPASVIERKDKMGFPVPLNDWLANGGIVSEYIRDIFNSRSAVERDYLTQPINIDQLLSKDGQFGRALWGLISIEMWQRKIVDGVKKWK